MDGADGSTTGTSLQTDSEGNFELSVHNYGIHALKLDYMGLTSISDLFIVKDRQPYDELVLTLSGDPSELSDVEENEINEYHFQYTNIINFPNVWVINPENGHAYKAIWCDGSKEDAEAKAEAEDAYLVSITNEAERVWLDVVYEGMDYWRKGKWERGPARTTTRMAVIEKGRMSTNTLKDSE